MTLQQFFDSYYRTLRILSTGSVIQYEVAIRSFTAHAGREISIHEVSGDSLASYAGWMLKKGRSRATTNKVLRHLRALLRSAKRKRLLAEVPEMESIPERRKAPTFWTANEFWRIVAHCDPHTGAIMRVIYDTGLRIGDVLALRWCQIDTETRVVRLVEQKTNKHRAFVLHPDTIMSLNAIRTLGSDLVFAAGYTSPRPYRLRLKKAIRLAGMPVVRGCLFHQVRRTVATLSKAIGQNATAILGHSSEWVTDTFYVSPTAIPPIDTTAFLPRPAPVAPSVAGVMETMAVGQ